MSELVADCPRCKAQKITFDLIASIPTGVYYDWQHWYEAFCICRNCDRSTVFVLSQREYGTIKSETKLEHAALSVNHLMEIRGHISLKDMAARKPPEDLPLKVEAAFQEGAACMVIGCPNAAATMFRLCIDLSTREVLPQGNGNGPNARTRRDLGLRLPWLFDNGKLPSDLRDLSTCIKEEGNDGAHQGTLSEEDAADILDFTFVLLERLYTEPKRIELAKERREARRATE